MTFESEPRLRRLRFLIVATTTKRLRYVHHVGVRVKRWGEQFVACVEFVCALIAPKVGHGARPMPASREHVMLYQGRERRRRFVYVTRNTEYHVMDRVCVGVRDRQSGSWQHAHIAVQRRLEGGARVLGNGAIIPSLDGPAVGNCIYFVIEDVEDMREIVTSRLEAIERPEIEDLMHYPAA